MLGAWPCGIIILLGELFGAESNSQVYAMLHTFLLKNSSSTKETRKFAVVYVLSRWFIYSKGSKVIIRFYHIHIYRLCVL